MTRTDWLSMIRFTYAHQFSQDQPKFIVFCDQVVVDSDHGREIENWLNEHHYGRWVYIGENDPIIYTIVGFQDEEVAMKFKLTYGDGRAR